MLVVTNGRDVYKPEAASVVARTRAGVAEWPRLGSSLP